MADDLTYFPEADLDYGRSKAFRRPDGSVEYRGGAHDGEVFSPAQIDTLRRHAQQAMRQAQEAENVTTLRTATIADIPAMLRKMADQIDNGDVAAASMLVIIPRDGDWPDIYGWGEHLGDHGNIAICEMAKTWYVQNLSAKFAG